MCQHKQSILVPPINALPERFVMTTHSDPIIRHSHLQAAIGNYAVPILEERTVWGTNDVSRIAYMDSTDVAKLTLAALRWVSEAANHHSVSISNQPRVQ